MANIQKLTYPYFTDGSTQLNAANLNPIISKLNEVIDQVNSGVSPTQTVATPTISISGTTATISCSTSGATIYYTTNGNTPTTSSTQYSSPITLPGACTIKAIAVKSGMNNSSVASVDYSPSASVQSPTIYIRDLAIIMDAESGASIYYTTDGSTPTSSSTQYANAFTLPNNATVKAIAVKNGSSSSAASASFTAPQRTTQRFPQIVVEGNKVTILSNGVGTLKYDYDSGTSYPDYTEPLTVTQPCRIKARCVNGGSTMMCSLDFTGEEAIAVNVIPQQTTEGGYVSYSESTSTNLSIKTTASIKLRFFPIVSGRKYVVCGYGTSNVAAFWAYASTVLDSITEATTIAGKLDSNVPASSGGSDKQTLAINSAENYPYIVTSSSQSDYAVPVREVIVS